MNFFLSFFVWLSCGTALADRVPGEWLVRTAPGRAVPAGEPVGFGYVLVRGELPRAASATGTQPNFRYTTFEGDPDLDKSWGLNNFGQAVDSLGTGVAGVDVGALKAWAIHAGDGSVVVAVLDSGVDRSHEDLAGNLDSRAWNFIDGNGDVTDKNGHGTLVSGIIGAIGDNGRGSRGVNGHVKILAVKFLDDSGVGSTANALKAIDYAIEKGAAVINASWGGTEYDPALFDAVKKAGEQGVLFVAAAGNNGKNNDTDRSPIYPASFRLPTLVSVAAYDNRDHLASFSNYGKETVHLGAPGVAVYGPSPGGYRFGEGTSFAAPFVAGGAALVKSFSPGLTLQQLRERLFATTEPIHYYEKERSQTGGRLNLFNLLRDVRPPRPKAPSTWDARVFTGATPHPYLNNQTVRFELNSPGDAHVRVHFRGFSTESCCDRVVLKDKNLREVASYSGKLGDFWSADAIGDTLIIEFTPDYSVGDYGFEIDSAQGSPESVAENETALPVPPYRAVLNLFDAAAYRGFAAAGRFANSMKFDFTRPSKRCVE